MMATPARAGNGWTAETRIIWALFGVIGTLIVVIVSLLWGQVEKNEQDIRELSDFVTRSDGVHREVLRRLGRIEDAIESR
jgi:hypothetical protein